MNFTDCLLKIYNAATSNNMWDESMDAIAHHTGAVGAILVQNQNGLFDLAPRRVSKVWRSMPPDILQTAVTESNKYEGDAWNQIALTPALNLILDTAASSAELLDARPDLTLLREAVGMRRRAAMNLSKHPGYVEILGLQFDQQFPQLTSEHKSTITGIAPHVAKVAEISRTFSILEQRYQAVLLALDNVHIGVCIVRHKAEAILINKEARRILDERDGLFLASDNRLRCTKKDESAELIHAINSAMSTLDGSGNQTEWLIPVKRADNRKPILVEVTPITDGLSEIDRGFQGALVYLIDPENSAPLKISRVASVCQFTPAETAVCECLTHGWTNGDIADDRGVGVETVKSQVASILSKTGTRNRSELIRLILKISPPVG